MTKDREIDPENCDNAQRKTVEQPPRREDCAGCEFAERSLQGVAILQDRRLVYVNPAICGMVGRTQEELLALPPDQVTAIIHPEDRVRSLVAVQSWLEGQRPPTQEAYRVLHRNGTIRWLMVQATPAGHRNRPAIQVAVIDVTESKRAQRALERSVQEVERQQRLLLALSRAAQAVQRAHSPGEVYGAVAEELSRLHLNATILTLTEDREHLVASHISFAGAAIRAAERITGGIPMIGHTFPIPPGGFYAQVIGNGEAIFTDQGGQAISEALPEPQRKHAAKLAQLLGIKGRIATPLAAGDQMYGMLLVTGRGLSEADVPAISAFANQAAIALQNAELLDAVDRQRKELRLLSTHLMHAQEMERRTIAQELHDETGQALTALSINLAEIEKTMPSDLLPTVAGRLAESRALTDRTLEQIRELSLSLRPSLLDDLGLVPALRWYTKRYAQRTHIAVEFRAQGLNERLPYAVETTLYRVVQEALTNVARHARAANVQVHLQRCGLGIVAVMQDDGRGFDPKVQLSPDTPSHGAGLLGMRERASMLGGEVRVDSQLGQGTRITVEIPLPEKL